jgi:hypothetical protein
LRKRETGLEGKPVGLSEQTLPTLGVHKEPEPLNLTWTKGDSTSLSLQQLLLSSQVKAKWAGASARRGKGLNPLLPSCTPKGGYLPKAGTRKRIKVE